MCGKLGRKLVFLLPLMRMLIWLGTRFLSQVYHLLHLLPEG